MVVGLLGEDRDLGHEPDGLDEIGELEGAGYLIAQPTPSGMAIEEPRDLSFGEQ